MRLGKVEGDGDEVFRELAIVRLQRARLANVQSSVKVVTVTVFGSNEGRNGGGMLLPPGVSIASFSSRWTHTPHSPCI